MHNSLTNRAPAKEKDGLIPLINIVFLLLIFFMVAGQMQPLQREEISLVKTQAGIPQKELPIILEYNRQAEIFLAGRPISLSELKYSLKAGELDKRQLGLHVDKQVTAEQLDQLLDILRQQQIKNINLAVAPDDNGEA